MFKNIIKNERFAEIFRFIVNGGICCVIDWGVMMLLMEFTSLPDWFSIGAGFTVSVIVNYIICVLWVFKGAEKQSFSSKIIFVGSSLIGLGLTELLMLILIKFIPPAIAKVFVTGIVMIWNYLMKRIAIYGIKKGK